MLCIGATASTTIVKEFRTFGDFRECTLQNLSVSEDGWVRPAPTLKKRASGDWEYAWDAAMAGKVLYVSTGNAIVCVDEANKGRVVYRDEKRIFFSIAYDGDDRLFAGATPDGKILVFEGVKAGEEKMTREITLKGAATVWDMHIEGTTLYAATGNDGTLYAVSLKDYSVKKLFEAKKSRNVLCVATAPDATVYFGLGGEGLLCAMKDGRSRVLYDADEKEIVSVEVLPDGGILFAAVDGKGKAIQTGSAAARMEMMQRIMQAARRGAMSVATGRGKMPEKKTTPADKVMKAESKGKPSGRGTIYLLKDGRIRRLLYSPSEALTGAAALDETVVAGVLAGEKARLVGIDRDNKLSILTEVKNKHITRLIHRGKTLLVCTSAPGAVYEMEAGTFSRKGTLITPVTDGGNICKWGRAWCDAVLPDGASITLYSRSGNTEEPDDTWSRWEAVKDGAVRSPAARYIQCKAVVSWKGERPPALDVLSISYLPANRRPSLSRLVVSARTKPSRRAGNKAAAIAALLETVAGKKGARQGKTVPAALQAKWEAVDPDGDELVYDVYLKAEGEKEWKPVKKNTSKNSLDISSLLLPDGKYRIKVVASDRLVTDTAHALTDESTSEYFVVDRTPPRTTPVEVEVRKKGCTLSFEASDTFSRIAACRWRLDTEEKWYTAAPIDGLYDQKTERFSIRLEEPGKGEHVVTVLVVDSVGNIARLRVTFEVK